MASNVNGRLFFRLGISWVCPGRRMNNVLGNTPTARIWTISNQVRPRKPPMRPNIGTIPFTLKTSLFAVRNGAGLRWTASNCSAGIPYSLSLNRSPYPIILQKAIGHSAYCRRKHVHDKLACEKTTPHYTNSGCIVHPSNNILVET